MVKTVLVSSIFNLGSIWAEMYGKKDNFDNIDQNQMFEYCLTPQHASGGLVGAIQCRDATNKEMERQVKKYGRDQLAPPLHAHDGLDKTAVDNEVFTRALVLKGAQEPACGGGGVKCDARLMVSRAEDEG